MPLSYVLVNVELGSEEKVLKEVRGGSPCERMPPNLWNMIVKVEADSMDELKEVITWKIRRLQGVRSTLTTIVIE